MLNAEYRIMLLKIEENLTLFRTIKQINVKEPSDRVKFLLEAFYVD